MPRHYRLHVNVFAMPPQAKPGPVVTLRGVELPTLMGEHGGPPPFTAPLPVGFEEMQRQLLELPRSDCEPDGFFLLTGGKQDDPANPFWRLNGHMHEAAMPTGENPMHRVELNGDCSQEIFDAVLRTMGWPATPLAFELVQEGVTLEERAFREWAAAKA